MKRLVSVMLAALLTSGWAASALPPGSEAFIDGLVRRDGLDRNQVTDILAKARKLPEVLAAIRKPAEHKPWYAYAPIFLTQERVAEGIAFWNAHDTMLAAVSQRFHVAPEFIVAILGVETRYGKHAGRYRVLDALNTLAFYYPPRSAFFRRQLAQFLLLQRDESPVSLAVLGSYAGAMGMGQFVASSYRQYAVDFDQDGVRDLLDNPADAVASVANYLAAHGWREDQLVAIPARAERGRRLQGSVELDSSVSEYAAIGVQSDTPLPGNTPAMLVRLDTGHGIQFWLGLNNFYVITRYNHSPLYAMAVFQLAQAIRHRHLSD